MKSLRYEMSLSSVASDPRTATSSPANPECLAPQTQTREREGGWVCLCCADRGVGMGGFGWVRIERRIWVFLLFCGLCPIRMCLQGLHCRFARMRRRLTGGAGPRRIRRRSALPFFF